MKFINDNIYINVQDVPPEYTQSDISHINKDNKNLLLLLKTHIG